ncbi:MAG: hypothetical protein WAW30_06355 [Patescibacteria group bacterium]
MEKPYTKTETFKEITIHLKKVKKDWKVLLFLLLLLVGAISSEPYFYKWLISSIEEQR